MAPWRDFKQEFLTCSLCTNLYDSEIRIPKCLPCLHCFCKPCLKRLITGKGDVKCPDCRKQYTVPEDGADGFVTNFNVENLRDYQNLHQERRVSSGDSEEHANMCTSCDEDNPATGYCYECEAYVCQKCTDNHSSMRRLRSHDIETVSDKQRHDRLLTKRQRSYDRCRDHKKAYSMYCKTCKQPICDTCGQITTHSNHAKVDLNIAVTQKVAALKALSNTVRKRREPLVTLSGTIDTRINDISTIFGKQKEDIDEVFQKLASKLHDRCARAKEELQGHCQAMNKLLKEQKDDVEALVAQYDSACDFADQTCDFASSKQLFKFQEMITNQLDDLNSQTISQTEPIANSFLDFDSHHHEVMRSIDATFSSIGGTRTSDTSAPQCYVEELKANISLGIPQITQIRAINYDGKPQLRGGDVFTAELQAPDGTSTICEVSDNNDGSYKVSYTADQPGTHYLHARVFGRPVCGSPFPINVQRDIDTGHEVEVNFPDVALVGYPHKIFVNISRENDIAEAKASRIQATIETRTGDAVKSTSRAADAESGNYVIEYTPPVDGPLNAIITVNGKSVAGNPYVIHVQSASPKASIVDFGGPVSNQVWSIRVSPRDYRQNPISVNEDALRLKVIKEADNTEHVLTCRRNNDEELVYTSIPESGSYLVKAFLYNILITEVRIEVQDFMEINLAKNAKSFPTSITSGVGGSLFLSDTVDSKIYRFSENLVGEAKVLIDMSKSSEITIDDQGRLLLLFPQTKMVHTIDQQGNELSRWACEKKNSRPVSILSSREGRVIIADSKIPSMYIYKSDGELKNTQELPEKSIKDGVNNICVDKRSSIILAHHSLPKIFTHNSDGQPRGQFASGATSYQLAVACTDEDVLLVAQLGNIRLISFRGVKANFLGEIPLVSGHIFTGLVATNDACVVGLDVGYKRLVKYGHKVKR